MKRDDPLSRPEPLIRRVYSYAAYRLGHGPDAEDAASETFARALRYRSAYDAGAGSVQAWLLGIARRVVDEAFAARARMGDLPGELADGGDLASLVADRVITLQQ